MLISQRYLIWLLGFYGTVLMTSPRASLSVAIVSMVKLKNNTSHRSAGSCLPALFGNQTFVGFVNKSPGTYEWSETLQGIILGAQLYPTVIMPVVAGWLADRFGAKWLTAVSVAGPGLLAALIPTAADYGKDNAYPLIGLLLVMGSLSACLLPALFSMYANWFPMTEMGSATGSMAFGNGLGLVIMFPVAGYLCEYAKWPMAFYATSLIHLPWLISWCWLTSDLPSQSKIISPKELEFIRSNSACYKIKKHNVPVPWSSMVRSMPVWASVAAKCAENFGYFLLLTKMPTYLDLVFGISMHENGILNSVFHLTGSIMALVAGPLSGWILQLNIISLTSTRKSFELVGLFGAALSTVLVPYFGCDATTVVALFICSMMAYGLLAGGEWPLPAECAPDFAGTVFGFTYSISITTSFVAPFVAGLYLDDDPSDKSEWDAIFYLTAIIYVTGALIFGLFASAEPEPWGVITNYEEDKKKSQRAVNYGIANLAMNLSDEHPKK